jgi:transposase
VFLTKSKDGDYHQEMNSVFFLEWFEKQLMPTLKNSSLVVLDNASYHNVKIKDTVFSNFIQKKAVLQNYLT